MPEVSRQFLQKLKATFPPVKPIPNVTTLEELMFNAGQQELIQWIEHHANKEMIITGAMG